VYGAMQVQSGHTLIFISVEIFTFDPLQDLSVLLLEVFFNKYFCRDLRLLSSIHALSVSIHHHSNPAHAIGTSNQVSRWRLGAILVVLVLLIRCSNTYMVIIWSCLRYYLY
jgi:hypothetical protein